MIPEEVFEALVELTHDEWQMLKKSVSQHFDKRQKDIEHEVSTRIGSEKLGLGMTAKELEAVTYKNIAWLKELHEKWNS